jgi:hypothetical protein
VKRRLWIAANALMLLAFAFSVIVQVNDPDPFAWIAIYGLAALGCLLALLGRGSRAFFVLVALGAAAWAVLIAPRALGRVPFVDMFGAFEMESLAVEESREMYGLVIIAAWMGVLAVVPRRRPSGGGAAG